MIAMLKSKKLWIAVFLAAVAIGAGLGYFFFSKKGEVIVSRYKAERRRIEKTISAQGLLEPLSYVDLGSQVSGQITKIHVAVGDLVKKDRLLLEIDPRT
jgi:macrolide-specific efflux system membrane fusion protein